MLLGIDLGSTWAVVAAAEKVGYSVVGFRLPGGRTQFGYPAEVATQDGRIVYGLDAHRQTQGVLSLYHQLAQLGPQGQINLGGQDQPWLDVLTGYFAQLYHDLRKRSTLSLRRDEPLALWLTLSPEATGNARFVVLDAAARAGFQVMGLMEKTGAIGRDYRFNRSSKGQEDWISYDLGGTAFTCCRCSAAGDEILAQERLALGGNDFDRILADLALEQVPSLGTLTDEEQRALLARSREKKEQLRPNTRKLTLDLALVRSGLGEVAVDVTQYYQRCTPVIEQTLAVLDRVAGGSSSPVYGVGGASELPLVSRLLRAHLARRFYKANQPAAAAALGLIQGTPPLSSQGWFGIWREESSGQGITFDPLFALDQTGSPGEVLARRTYQPAHNVGHYRYLSCSQLDHSNIPAGLIRLRGECRFPLDPALIEEPDLQKIPVVRISFPEEGEIEESYQRNENGTIQVTLRQRSTGYSRSYSVNE